MASDSASPTTANFVITYGAVDGFPSSPDADAVCSR
jgi:hypothetical protein